MVVLLLVLVLRLLSQSVAAVLRQPARCRSDAVLSRCTRGSAAHRAHPLQRDAPRPQGHGVAADAVTARTYFEKAAAKGSAAGHNGLGMLHFLASGIASAWGLGPLPLPLPRISHSAHAHAVARAATCCGRRALSDAISAAGRRICPQGAGDLPRDYALALQHFRTAADVSHATNADSLFNLGTMHAAGDQTTRPAGLSWRVCCRWWAWRHLPPGSPTPAPPPACASQASASAPTPPRP